MNLKDESFKGMPVHVYSSGKGGRGRLQTLFRIWKEFPAAHALGWRFAERNFKAKYRQSVLGIFWLFLPPLATSILWIFLRKINVVHFSEMGVPYPLFVLTGTVLWSLFSNSLSMPLNVMQASKSLLVKINFPREALLVNAFYEIVFNFFISIIIIIVCLISFR